MHVERIRRAMERTGDHFLSSVFTEAERSYCKRFSDPCPHLAARFAAKESVMKCMGSFIRPLEIEITNEACGRPAVLLHGSAGQIARSKGIQRIMISLSHSGGLAIAQAVALSDATRSPSP